MKQHTGHRREGLAERPKGMRSVCPDNTQGRNIPAGRKSKCSELGLFGKKKKLSSMLLNQVKVGCRQGFTFLYLRKCVPWPPLQTNWKRKQQSHCSLRLFHKHLYSSHAHNSSLTPHELPWKYKHTGTSGRLTWPIPELHLARGTTTDTLGLGPTGALADPQWAALPWHLLLEYPGLLCPFISPASFKTEGLDITAQENSPKCPVWLGSPLCVCFSLTWFLSPLQTRTYGVSHLTLSFSRGGNLEFHLCISNS